MNVWGVLGASVVGWLIGMLWYSPVLFGKKWMKLSGITEKQVREQREKGMAKQFVASFIAVIVLAVVLDYVLARMNVMTAMSGALTGILLWAGLLATSMLNSVLWEDKPLAVYWINTSHYFVALAVMGALLATW